jgi:hypothetical protein
VGQGDGERIWTVTLLDLDPDAARFGRDLVKVKVIAPVAPAPDADSTADQAADAGPADQARDAGPTPETPTRMRHDQSAGAGLDGTE